MSCRERLIVFSADGKVLLVLSQPLHQEEINSEAAYDAFFVDFTEQLFTDQPGGGAVAERALVRTHIRVPWLGLGKNACAPGGVQARFRICLRGQAEVS